MASGPDTGATSEVAGAAIAEDTGRARTKNRYKRARIIYPPGRHDSSTQTPQLRGNLTTGQTANSADGFERGEADDAGSDHLADALFNPIAVKHRQLDDRPDGEGRDGIAVQVADAADQGVGHVHRRLE